MYFVFRVQIKTHLEENMNVVVLFRTWGSSALQPLVDQNEYYNNKHFKNVLFNLNFLPFLTFMLPDYFTAITLVFILLY